MPERFDRRKLLRGVAAGIIPTLVGVDVLRALQTAPLHEPGLEAVFPSDLVRELSTPFFIEDPHTGQKINVLFLNRKQLEIGKPLLITSNGFPGLLESASSIRNAGWEAYNTPLPFLVFEAPGIGNSDPLTRDQIMASRRGEFLDEVARAIGRAVRRFNLPVPNVHNPRKTTRYASRHKGQEIRVEKANMVGNSMAASLVSVLLSQAGEVGLEVEIGGEVEAVGVAPFTEPELTDRFVESGGVDPDVVWLGKLYLAWTVRNFPQQYIRAFADQFVPEALDTALTNKNLKKLIVGYAENSLLDPKRYVLPMIEDLSNKHPGKVISHEFKEDDHEIFNRSANHPYSWSSFLQQHFLK